MSPVGGDGPPEPLHTLHERLYQAAVNGEAHKIVELIKLGAKMIPDQEGRTPLHMACANGFVDAARSLILSGGAKINQLDACGYTPLHQAVMDGHVEVTRLLAKHGCALNMQERLSGNTALHEAAWRGFSKCVEVLAKAHANLYVKNKAGFTALHLAAQNGHNQSSRVLLMEGCGPDVKNNYGDTPLHTATRYGHAGVVRILVSAFANVQETNRNGDTALHISVAMRKRKLTKILLESRAAIHAKNEQGESPLDIARRKSFPELEEMLLNPPKPVPPLAVNNSSSNNNNDDDSQPRDERDGCRGRKREKDPNTSTSSGKPGGGRGGEGGGGGGRSGAGGNNSASRQRKKKSKTKDDSGGTIPIMQRSKSLPHANSVGPYGCPHSPHDMAGFPTPKIETLPSDPLAKGEQYYLDLAGNIRKGPVGRGHSCYCVPFFKDFEKRLQADKQDPNNKIGQPKQDTEKKLRSLERNTISQLQSLDLVTRDTNGNHHDNHSVEEPNDDADHSLEVFAESRIGRRTSPLGRSSPPSQAQQVENASMAGESRWSKLMECRASLGAKLEGSSGESSEDDEDEGERRPCSLEPIAVQPMPVLLHRNRPLSSSYLQLPNANLNEVGLPPPSAIGMPSRTLTRMERRPVSSFGSREPAAGRSPSLLDSGGTPPPSTIGTSLPPEGLGLRKPFCRPPRPPSYQTHMERIYRPGQQQAQQLSPSQPLLNVEPRPSSTPPKSSAPCQTIADSHDSPVPLTQGATTPNGGIHPNNHCANGGASAATTTTASTTSARPVSLSSTLARRPSLGGGGSVGGSAEMRASMQNLVAYVPTATLAAQPTYSYGKPLLVGNHHSSSAVSSLEAASRPSVVSRTLLDGGVPIEKTPAIGQPAISSPRSQRYIMSSEV